MNSEAQDRGGGGGGWTPQPRAPLGQDPHIGSRVVSKIPPSPHSRGAKATEGQRTTSPVPSLGDRESHHNRKDQERGRSCRAALVTRRPGLLPMSGFRNGSFPRCRGPACPGTKVPGSPGSGCPTLLRVTLPALRPWAPGRRQTPATLVTPTQSPPSCPPLKQVPLIGPGFRPLSHE